MAGAAIDTVGELADEALASLSADFGAGGKKRARAVWRLQQLIRADPVWFHRKVLGVEPWSKQCEILTYVRDYPRVGVQSGNNVGKSFVSAGTVLWWMAAHPGGKVVTTATTWAQVESVLWTEIASLHAKARVPLGGRLLKTEFQPTDGDPSWVAMGLSTNNSDSFVGRHAEYLLVIFDEAQGIEGPIWEAAETLASSSGCRILAIGNPLRCSGRFFEVCTGRIPGWRGLKISCLEHPNITQGRDADGNLPIPAAVSPEYIEGKRAEWGEDSPVWQSRIEGEFPTEDDWTLIPLGVLEDRKDHVPNDGSGVHIGVDVARMGSDRCVMTLLDDGLMRGVRSWTKTDLTTSAGIVWKQALKWEALLRKEKGRRSMKIPAKNIHVEMDGIGAGLYDAMRAAGRMVDGVTVGAAPGGEWGELVGREMRFRNRRSELHWVCRRLLDTGRLAVPDRYGKTWADLTRIRYAVDDRGIFYIEPKDKIKAREGRSPDFSDSLILALARSRRVRVSAGRLNSSDLDDDSTA